MGKQVPKSKSNKNEEKEEMEDDYDSQIDELYRPFLIHSTTYTVLTEQILALMPSERNVLLTMNEYDLSEINPMHPNTEDSPTHVIIFCIRFVAGDTFQPIGGLLIYKYKDQSTILAECLKAYINDLWKLGLYVVGTVSPPFESFKGMLSHLVDVKDFNTYSGSLVYSVSPIKEIVHIYDIQFLFIKLQNLFKEGDIKFVEVSREHRASWNDILRVLNLSSEFKILSNYLSDNKDVSRRVHVFTQQIFEQLLELEAQGALSKNAGGSAVMLNCIRSFLQFTELDLVDINQMCQIEGWTNFTSILPTMTFQKSKKRTCTKTKPSTAHIIANPSVRRKIDFNIEEEVNLIDDLTENVSDATLCDEQEDSIENECEIVQNSKTKKKDGKKTKNGKNKKGKARESTEKKAHPKKQEKQKTSKTNNLKSKNTSQNQKTDLGSNENNNTINGNVNTMTEILEDKLCSKTEDFQDINTENTNQEELDNKINFGCDRDKNNNSDESLQISDSFETKNNTSEAECNNKTKLNNKKNKTILKEENFDLVINDAQKFFESFFMGYNTPNNHFNSKTKVKNPQIVKNSKTTEVESSNPHVTESGSGDTLADEARSNIPQMGGKKKKRPQITEAKLKNPEISEVSVRDIPQTTEVNVQSPEASESKCNHSQVTEAKVMQNTKGDSNIVSTTETTSTNQVVDEEVGTGDIYRDSPPDVSNRAYLNKQNSTESYDDFCSQSDEETESCVTKICDKVPTLVESLGNEEGREIPPDDFEENDVTRELLSTVFGMKKLMENLIRRRVRIAKPDSFLVEHIDFLVTIIKRDKNKVNPVHYYGQNYGFLNAELAFSTLQNNTGLFLVRT